MSRTSAPTRRTVHYASLSDFREDVEELASQNCETTGNWSFAQIVQHLRGGINNSFDGFPFQASWPVRLLVRTLMKHSLLHKPMKPGFKLPKRAAPLLPSADVRLEQELTALRKSLDRFDSETPTAAHPILGRLTPEEWNLLHLRHAELHMGFVQRSQT